MIVVDTNVISYFWLKSDYSENTKSLFQTDPHWIAPFLWRSEFRSILALYMRKNLLSLSEAFEIMNEAKSMMEGNEFAVNSIDILKKINECKLSAYDLEYVCLAESFNLKLVTLDKKIIKEFPEIAVSLLSYY